MNKVRVLFLPVVDADNTNAQSLNVREIALRIDPDLFQSTLWYEREPDRRLRSVSNIRLLQLPSRGRTLRILREMVAGYDIIAYIDYSPACYVYLHLPHMIRRRAKAVFHAEAPSAQMVNPSHTLRFLSQGILSRCDVYTGITEFVARDLACDKKEGDIREGGANKSRASYILPVGVDTSLFTPPPERARPVPVVLFAGTLVERKGPQYVIDAAARFPGATFRLVGSGRQGFEKVLQEKIIQLGLKNVQLDGPKTQSQMVEIMRNSDILLFPSRLEGIPKVTLEAAATGLPCIVFRDYETPSVADSVSGFQVGTLEEMMRALGQLIDDRTLRERMGAAARKHVEKFDWDLVSRQWQSAYLEIAAAKAKTK
jgi:glycosyltransferase involved in cell wall biosynthesis